MNDSKMAAEDAVAALDAMDGQSDPEANHLAADGVLLMVVPEEVRRAYKRLVERSAWWAHS